MRCLREEKENRDIDGYIWLPSSVMGCGLSVEESLNDGIVPKVIVFSQYLVFLDQIVIDLRTAGKDLVKYFLRSDIESNFRRQLLFFSWKAKDGSSSTVSILSRCSRSRLATVCPERRNDIYI